MTPSLNGEGARRTRWSLLEVEDAMDDDFSGLVFFASGSKPRKSMVLCWGVSSDRNHHEIQCEKCKWGSNLRNWTTWWWSKKKLHQPWTPPTHPKINPNFNKIMPFFTSFSNSRALTYYTWVDLMWISLVKQYIQNFLYWKKNCISAMAPHKPIKCF